jgi:mannose-6-phosphate isomerase-like protein (cupin superfamily)
VRSVAPPGGALPGPHWHPVVEQTFSVEEGMVRFRVDGRELVLGAGESVTVRPGQVYEFENAGEGRLVIVEEDRPPERHA